MEKLRDSKTFTTPVMQKYKKKFTAAAGCVILLIDKVEDKKTSQHLCALR